MSVSFIGTLCGIFFVSLVIWNMVDGQLIQISFETPPQALFFQRNLGYLLRHISNTVQALHEKLLRLLTITVIYEIKQVVNTHLFFSSLVKFLLLSVNQEGGIDFIRK